MHTDCLLGARERLVKAGFSNIGPESVDSFQASGSIDREQVGAKADIGTILKMRLVEGKVSAAPVCVVGQIDVCDFGEEGAGIARKRMQGQAVEDNEGDLDSVSFVEYWEGRRLT